MKKNTTSANIPGHLTRQTKQIALIIETSNEYARNILKGIIKYKKENRDWALYLSEQSRGNTDLSWLANWKGDGILARIEAPIIADYIVEKNTPTVDLSSFNYISGNPFVETDDDAIARVAADHLISHGLTKFAYCGNSKYVWSKLRSHYFQKYIQEKGYPCFCYDSLPGNFNFEERLQIAQWLKTLPTPIGIMACFDRQGQQLLEACRMTDIVVPDDVAVIGVDNDHLICELSDPPLSSVIPDTEKTGYSAAALLDRMMRGEHIKNIQTLIKPLGVHARLSTDVLATSDKLISQAVQFIRNHACDGITVQDVLYGIPLSRRAFEHRFYKCLGRKPHDEILLQRFKHIKTLLAETDLTMMDIAERSGFRHPEYMTVAFKREIGMTPSDYRDQEQAKEILRRL